MLISGQNLFPLSLIDYDLLGYYMSHDGEIWSARRPPTLIRLAGSRTSAGRNVTLQVNGSSHTFRLDHLKNIAMNHAAFNGHTQSPLPAAFVGKTDLASVLGLKGHDAQQAAERTKQFLVKHGTTLRDQVKAAYTESMGEIKPLLDEARVTAQVLKAGWPFDPRPQVQAVRHHAKSTASGIKDKGWIIGCVAKDGGLTFSPAPAIHTTEGSVNAELQRLADSRPGVKFVKLRIEAALTVGAVWE